MMIRRFLSAVESGDKEALLRAVSAIEADRVAIPTEDKAMLVRTAARAGRAELLRWLFEHHFSAVEPDSRGRTVLHDAALSGDAETARFVMDVLGFDPLEGDFSGVTPLDQALSAADSSAFRLMAERTGCDPRTGYRNPVLRGFHPDPSVVRVGMDYYLVTSSFVFFPGLPIYHSRDLVHWREIGHAIQDFEKSGLAGLPGGFGYWAPDISYYNGRFWIVATLRRNTIPYRLQMITSANDPRGPWSPPRFLPLDGIDPSLFTDTDGRRYLLLNPGAMIVPISEAGEPLSAPRMISFGSARIKPEGPHLIRKDGWYYLFLAEGGTGEGHMETAARSKSLYGPYESCPFNPILGSKKPNAFIRRSGHGKPLCLPDGRWYMLYLCGRNVEGRSLMGRETALDPMTWTADGWPMVNRLGGPSCLQSAPLPAVPAENTGEAWIAPRSDPAAFSETAGDVIRLKAGSDPAGTGPCSLLLARQKEACFAQRVQADLSETEEGTTAGITGYYDECSFYLFGLRKEGTACDLVLTLQTGEDRNTRVITRINGCSAELSAAGNGLSRRLSLRRNEREAAGVTIRTEFLCDEGMPSGKRFTGAAAGLFACGKGTALFSGYALEWQNDSER